MDVLSNALGIHEKALRVRNQRMELLARNIANDDTPHFKARELDFKSVMAEFKPSDNMSSTHMTHFPYADKTRTMTVCVTACHSAHRSMATRLNCR